MARLVDRTRAASARQKICNLLVSSGPLPASRISQLLELPRGTAAVALHRLHAEGRVTYADQCYSRCIEQPPAASDGPAPAQEPRNISTTDFLRHFGTALHSVAVDGEQIVLTQHGRPVAILGPLPVLDKRR